MITSAVIASGNINAVVLVEIVTLSTAVCAFIDVDAVSVFLSETRVAFALKIYLLQSCRKGLVNSFDFKLFFLEHF